MSVAAEDRSVVFNGFSYKSLAEHDPHSTAPIDEYMNMLAIEPHWHVSPDTPDARHVCSTYPWAAYALVLADGSACWTALAPTGGLHSPQPVDCTRPNRWTALAPTGEPPRVPGELAPFGKCIKHHEGKYASRAVLPEGCAYGDQFEVGLVRCYDENGIASHAFTAVSDVLIRREL
jgi:hypothetical protein